ncbi:MAG: immunoglobulin domain-containing protein, partial [Bacilli bacterium]
IRPPIILDENNPADVSVGLYGSATFNVIASVENNNPITYQWYVSVDGSDSNMQPISGATSSTLTLNDIPFSYNGYKYMCEVSNASDPLDPASTMTVSSRIATLTVSPTPIIVQQPADVSVIEGDTASFNIVVNGGQLTYTWYYSPDGGVSWISIPNSNSPTYTVSAEYAMKGWLYYCEVSYPGGVLTSNQVSLTVSCGVTFIEKPQKCEVYTGETVEFKVKTYCPESGATFKWQYSFNG